MAELVTALGISADTDELLVAADLCDDYGFAEAAKFLREKLLTVGDARPCRIQIGNAECKAYLQEISWTRSPFDQGDITIDATFRAVVE